MVKYVDHMFFSLIYILCFKLSEFFLPLLLPPIMHAYMSIKI